MRQVWDVGWTVALLYAPVCPLLVLGTQCETDSWGLRQRLPALSQADRSGLRHAIAYEDTTATQRAWSSDVDTPSHQMCGDSSSSGGSSAPRQRPPKTKDSGWSTGVVTSRGDGGESAPLPQENSCGTPRRSGSDGVRTRQEQATGKNDGALDEGRATSGAGGGSWTRKLDGCAVHVGCLPQCRRRPCASPHIHSSLHPLRVMCGERPAADGAGGGRHEQMAAPHLARTGEAACDTDTTGRATHVERLPQHRRRPCASPDIHSSLHPLRMTCGERTAGDGPRGGTHKRMVPSSPGIADGDGFKRHKSGGRMATHVECLPQHRRWLRASSHTHTSLHPLRVMCDERVATDGPGGGRHERATALALHPMGGVTGWIFFNQRDSA